MYKQTRKVRSRKVDERNWRGYAALLLVILTPPLSQWLLIEGDVLAVGANVDGLVLAPAGLVAAAALYAARRIRPDSCPPWVLAAVTAVGLKALGLAGLQLSGASLSVDQSRWIVVVDILFVGAVIGFSLLDRRRWFRARPVLWGVALGLAVNLLRIVVVRQELWLRESAGSMVVACAVIVILMATLAAALHRSLRDRPQVRDCFVVSVVLFALTRILQIIGPGEQLFAVCALITAAMAAAALLHGAARALRASLAAQEEASTTLEQQLALIEQEGRGHRIRLHEIESSVMGIARAHELVRRPDGIAEEQRSRLEVMIHEELGRLERLLQHQDRLGAAAAGQSVWSGEPPTYRDVVRPAPTGPAGGNDEFDLDRTLSTLATAHEAKGNRVSWQPTGQRLRGHCDEVAEVLNILFDNAARHARSEASVAVHAGDGTVEILVSDTGPGIAPEVREQLFQFGARGPGSPGQGIGLHHAAGLMTQLGGYLRLSEHAEAGRSGATFVVGLPRRAC